MTPYLRVLEHLAYVMGCIALTYLGEAKYELGRLADLVAADSRYAVAENMETAKQLRAALKLFYEDDGALKAASMLWRVNSTLWSPVMAAVNGESPSPVPITPE